jgi:hypothetical protein
LSDGALQSASEPVSRADRIEINAVLRYLIATHGVEALGSWAPDSLEADQVLAGDRWRHQPYAAQATREIVESIGLEYAGPTARVPQDRFRFNDLSAAAVPIAGYGYTVSVSRGFKQFRIDGLLCSWSVAPRELWGEVGFPGGDTVRLDLAPVVERLRAEEPDVGPETRFLITAETERARVMLHLHSIGGRLDDKGPEIRVMQGDLYLDLP